MSIFKLGIRQASLINEADGEEEEAETAVAVALQVMRADAIGGGRTRSEWIACSILNSVGKFGPRIA